MRRARQPGAGSGTARSDSAHRAAASALRLPQGDPVVAPARPAGERQESSAADAGRQSVGPAEEEVRGHHGFRARLPGVSQPSQKPGVARCQPTLGGGHHLRAAAGRVRVSGGGAGCLLATGDRLGLGPQLGSAAGVGGAGGCHRRTTSSSRFGASLENAYMKMETVEHFAKIALVTHLLGHEQPLDEKEVEKLAAVRDRYNGGAKLAQAKMSVEGDDLRSETEPRETADSRG